jgi:hypothetical protein
MAVTLRPVGHSLTPRLGHATFEVAAAREERPELLHREEDDNPSRPGIFAFYDWCWGSDELWLIARMSDNSTFRHR